MDRRTAQFILTSATVTMAACVAAGAGGQDALGDGQVLDANLSTQSTRNSAVSPQNPGAIGNQIVTRNVAGGRGFRGSVGYRGAGDFRGQAGSNDLFEFRANSALSDLAYVTMSASGRALDLGQAFGIVEYRRPTAGASLGGIEQQGRPAYGAYTELNSAIHQITMARSSNADLIDPATEGALLAIGNTADGSRARVRVSEVRGVQVLPEAADLSSIGLTLYDQARVMQESLEDTAPQAGRPFDETTSQFALAPDRLQVERIGDNTGMQVSADYEDIMETLAERVMRRGTGSHTEQVDLTEEVQQEMNDLQTFLAGGEFDESQEPTDPARETTSPQDNRIPGLPDIDQVPQLPPDANRARDIDLSILRHGGRVDTLTPDSETRFAEMLAAGQDHLKEQEYFMAERDFTRALRFTPNHPLALAGLCNSQLGAGVQAAAAATMRSLFTRHPQMIDARFGPEILPPRERLDELAELLTFRTRDLGASKSELGLLIAYIGHQTEQRELVERGLGFMRTADAEDPLLVVLSGIWLGDDEVDDADDASDSDSDGGDEGE